MLLQLAKTTPYISGQQRIDVVLKKEQTYLTENSIHIVPLSDKVIYNENDKRPAFNYSHGENIKYLYEQTHQTFWNAVRERNDSLVYSKDTIDTYDHTYQRGLKRLRYSRYNKQFSFFCPVWIDTEWSDNYVFRVSLIVPNENHPTVLGRKIIRFSDEFTNYLKAYLEGNTDELLNINIDKNLATIKGCSVISGSDNIVDISYIIRNILSRERPLMEFDSILCSTFRQNKLIAKQLINFSFAFNFDDVASAFALSSIGSDLSLQCYVEFGMMENSTFVPFELRDIYSNYVKIPAYEITTHSYNYNVLDYLEDNNCIDIIYENRCVQPLCHWSLSDNPDYLYNFYNGFSPFYKESDNENSENRTISRNTNSQFKQVWGSYYGTPVLGYNKYLEKMCNLDWVKNYTNSDYYAVNNMFENHKSDMTKVPVPSDIYTDTFEAKVDSFWMYWLKYNAYIVTKDEDEISGFLNNFGNTENLYFSYIVYDNGPLSNLSIINSADVTITIDSQNYSGRVSVRELDGDDVCVALFVENDLTNPIIDKLIVGNYDEFTFNVLDDIDDYLTADKINAFLTHIFIIRNAVIPPSKFIFDRGVTPVKADKSLTNSDEIRYVKADKNAYTYMYRYTGHLIPMFVSVYDSEKRNMEWMPKQFSNTTDAVAKTINKGYIADKKQLYPSMGWYTIENMDFRISGVLKDTTQYEFYPEYINNIYPSDFKCTEYCWFDKSLGIYINNNYHATYMRDGNNTTEYLNDEIAAKILGETIFGTNVYNDYKAYINKYIIPLYEYTFDFDYVEPDSIEKILYNIEYKLR